MPSKELIEKVARTLFDAIDENTYKSKDDGDEWGVIDGEVNFHELAQTAISTILAAIQEPTEGMLDAGCKAWGVDINADETRENIANEWRQMLAASALGEQSE